MIKKIKALKGQAISLRIVDSALWLLAALHTLAALSLLALFFFITPAQAKEDLACGGHSILAQLQKDDPKGYARIEKEGAELANGEAIFWKIEKPGIPDSYLLGTMHMSDPRVISLPNAAQKDFDTAKTVIVESDEILDKKKASMRLMARPELTMLTNGKTIYDYIDDKQKALLEKQLLARGIPLAAVAKMQPWMISSFLALPVCELKRKAAGAEVLDEKLAKDAVADGKKLVGLETFAEQLEAMTSVSIKTHIAGLVALLSDPQQTKDMMETMIELYDQGKPALIGPLSEYIDRKAASGADIADFEKKMVTIRNHHMADRAAPVLDKGNAFMAVGALHLSGPEGLVALFREKGFKVTPVH